MRDAGNATLCSMGLTDLMISACQPQPPSLYYHLPVRGVSERECCCPTAARGRGASAGVPLGTVLSRSGCPPVPHLPIYVCKSLRASEGVGGRSRLLGVGLLAESVGDFVGARVGS